jgi:hypothetical protein
MVLSEDQLALSDEHGHFAGWVLWKEAFTTRTRTLRSPTVEWRYAGHNKRLKGEFP